MLLWYRVTGPGFSMVGAGRPGPQRTRWARSPRGFVAAAPDKVGRIVPSGAGALQLEDNFGTGFAPEGSAIQEPVQDRY